MKIAVTGGTGFVGRHLVNRLIQLGNTVHVLSRNRPIQERSGVRWFQADLTSGHSKLIPFLNNTDILYHCAAELTREDEMSRLHVNGTENLLTAAAGRVGRWVQLSSVGVYGPQTKGIVTEETRESPEGIYEKSKLHSDKLILSEAGKTGLEFTILRPSNVFGLDMVNQSLFQLIKMINRGLFFYVGPPGAVASYVHVNNVVEALVKCGRHEDASGQMFNLSDQMPLEEFVKTIACVLDRPEPRLRIPQWISGAIAGTAGRLKGFPLTSSRVTALTTRRVYAVDKIRRVLNYDHVISLDAGIRQMAVAWQKKVGQTIF